MAKHDWERWRHLYVTGEDDITLVTLALIPGSPSLASLKRRSMQELWTDQRKRFRSQRDTQAIRDDAAVAAATKVSQLVDAAEMLTRHMKAFRLAGGKAISKLQDVDSKNLSIREALDLLKWAVEGERLTEGLATSRQEIDFSQLSDAELERLARGNG